MTEKSHYSASPGRHADHYRTYRRGGERPRVSRRLLLATALAGSLLVLFLVAVFSAVRITGLARENIALEAELARTRGELGRMAPELERTKQSMAALVSGRLPYLRQLVPDKVLKIGGPYLKNIIFTVLNQHGVTHYEYLLVMENTTARTVHPAARVLLFDRSGVQIGASEVAGQGDLAPGESRSQSAMVDRFIDAQPRYFYVSTLSFDRSARGIH